MTLRNLIKQLMGVDGDEVDLDAQVMIRVLRRRPSGEVNAGLPVAHKLVPVSRVSAFRPGDFIKPVVDIVIEQDDLDAAKEVLR